MNGYNFTERVRKVLASAREEAARLHHEYVGTEHELLGLLREDEGVAATTLVNLNADRDAIRDRIESIIKRGRSEPVGPDLPYTSRAKKVLEFAMSESREMNHTYVGTEHLLLGLLREDHGIAAQVLVDSGVTLDAARDEVQRLLGPVPDRREELARPRPARRAGTPIESAAAPGRVGKVLADARGVAARFGARRLAATHAAIALFAHGEGTACAALERMGCNLDELARALEPSADPVGSTPSAEVLPLAADLEQALVVAQQEQQEWRAPALGTHHLLLGLMETCPELAGPLQARGVTPQQFRIEAGRLIG